MLFISPAGMSCLVAVHNIKVMLGRGYRNRMNPLIFSTGLPVEKRMKNHCPAFRASPRNEINVL